jgi:protein-S-isoprenylcysteine O-methyltransferase Ste14
MIIESPVLSAWIILLAFGLYGVVHSLLASLPVKALVSTLFGKTGERFYRLFYNVFATITIVPILVLPFTLPNVRWYSIPEPWSYLMYAVQLLALGLLGISILQTGVFELLGFSQVLGIEPKDRLNTAGMYGYIRHPLYTFSIIALWFNPSMTVNSAALTLAFTLYFIFGAMVEERKMVKVFGQEYRDYQANTPMFIPFIKRINKTQGEN